MTAKIIDGKKIADLIMCKHSRHIANICKHHSPKLAIILVGSDPASCSYVQKKFDACEKYKIIPALFKFEHGVAESEVLDKIRQLNADLSVFGILVQLPLPDSLNKHLILSAIDPVKDVDCLHPKNLGYLVQGREYVKPCAVEAVMQVIAFNNIVTKGKRVVIINRGSLIGQPLLNVLTRNVENGNATVSVCHEFTNNLPELCRNSDIIITAVGKRDKFVVDDSFIKDGAVVIDIGFSKLGQKVVGDVDASKMDRVSILTPVPNGIGPITIACLLSNFVKITSYQIKKARRSRSISYTKKKYQDCKKGGMCRCGKVLDRNGILCSECLNKSRQQNAVLLEAKKRDNECRNCPQKKLLETSYCSGCYLKILAKSHLGSTDNWKLLRELFEKQHICPYTGIELVLGDNASLDRIVPRAKGGQDVIENMQWVYKPINVLKWDYSESEFLENICLVYEYRLKKDKS